MEQHGGSPRGQSTLWIGSLTFFPLQAVSSDAASRRAGHPDVHAKIASVYWAEKLYPAARRHYMLSNDGEVPIRFLQ